MIGQINVSRRKEFGAQCSMYCVSHHKDLVSFTTAHRRFNNSIWVRGEQLNEEILKRKLSILITVKHDQDEDRKSYLFSKFNLKSQVKTVIALEPCNDLLVCVFVQKRGGGLARGRHKYMCRKNS